MTTLTTVDVSVDARPRFGYMAPSAQPSVDLSWRPVPHVFLVGFKIENNSTGVSEVECRRL